MKKPELSPVRALLQLVWDNTNKATGHSWERLNHAMHEALRLAIGAGFTFEINDFEDLPLFRCDRWIGASTEWCYAMAVAEGNRAAVKAYEAWQEREPLIADDVTPAEGHGGYAHLTGTRQQERLHVGCTFPWRGETVCVTSFSAAGAAIACAYHKGEEWQRKVKNRYTITREGIIADRAERKERADLFRQLSDLAAAGKSKAILEELGAATRAEFDALPLAKIRKVLKRLQDGE